MSKVQIYSHGIVHCSVCVPASMKKQEVEKEVNLQNPTGLKNGWKIDKKKFRDGSPNPNQCEDDKLRKHYLMVC